jgi:hypothetical protein
MHLAGQILRVHVSFTRFCFYFYLNAILPLSDCQDILTEILLKKKKVKKIEYYITFIELIFYFI